MLGVLWEREGGGEAGEVEAREKVVMGAEDSSSFAAFASKSFEGGRENAGLGGVEAAGEEGGEFEEAEAEVDGAGNEDVWVVAAEDHEESWAG